MASGSRALATRAGAKLAITMLATMGVDPAAAHDFRLSLCRGLVRLGGFSAASGHRSAREEGRV